MSFTGSRVDCSRGGAHPRFFGRLFPPSLTLGLANAGVEKGLHAATLDLARDEKNVILQLDLENAFNTFRRKVLLQHLERRLTDDEVEFGWMIRYFLARYAKQMDIEFSVNGKKAFARSGRGVVPGDSSRS